MAQGSDFSNLDDLALGGGEDNREFSWEKHYPGDQGLSEQEHRHRQQQQREEERHRELQPRADAAYLSGEETEDELPAARQPAPSASGLESGTESEGRQGLHASASGLDISAPVSGPDGFPAAAQASWPYSTAQMQAGGQGAGRGLSAGQLSVPSMQPALRQASSRSPSVVSAVAGYGGEAGLHAAYSGSTGYPAMSGGSYAAHSSAYFPSSAAASQAAIPSMIPAAGEGSVPSSGQPSAQPGLMASLAAASRAAAANAAAAPSMPSARTTQPSANSGFVAVPGRLGSANGQQIGLRQPSTASPAQRPGSANGDGSGTDTDDDGKLIQKAKGAIALPVPPVPVPSVPKPAPKKRAAPGKPRAGGGLSLKLLIDEGILWAGENVLSVEYKTTMTYASLTPDGKILCKINGEQMSFDSPSAFSIYLKRLVNPSRKADDGWKTVKYAGKYLEHYKLELARKRYPGAGAPGAGPGASQAGSMGVSANTASGVSDGAASAGVSGRSAEGPPAKRAKVEGQLKTQFKLKVPKPKTTTPKLSLSLHRPEANGHHRRPDLSEYAQARPKRQVRAPSRLGINVDDPHQMVQPERFAGQPGSGQESAQPFRIEVSPAAQLIMDFHAHLNMNEIIGILGGSWDEEQRLIRVERAFPVRELQTEDDSINVEMDPEDEFAVRNDIQTKHGMRCVGWYHSHPNFPTLPSIIDIHNQVTQQHAHRSDGGAEPYIAAIVGPYDKRLPDPQSSLAWFYVRHPPGKLPAADQDPMQAGCTAMELEVTTTSDAARDAALLNMPQGEMHQLAKRYANEGTRAEMKAVWKDGLTNMEKLKASLVLRLPPSWSQKLMREFFMKMEAVVMATWNVFAPQRRQVAQAEDRSGDLTEDEAEAAAEAHAVEDEPEISDLTADAEPTAARNGELDDTAGAAGPRGFKSQASAEPEISESTQEASDGGGAGRTQRGQRAQQDLDDDLGDDGLSVADSQETE